MHNNNSNTSISADFRTTWENYTDLWKTDNANTKRQKIANILAENCSYTDPISNTIGHEPLIETILGFNKINPGAYFSTTRFMTHNNRCVAAWEMKNANAETLGSGISFAEYDDFGKLNAINGFYDLPESD